MAIVKFATTDDLAYRCPLPAAETTDPDTTFVSDNSGLVIGQTSSGTEELKKRVPKAGVVAASSTVPSEVLFSVYEAKRKPRRPSLVYCGDDQTGKEVAVELIRGAGFEPVDVGPLRVARYTEPFALLIGELAYGGTAGPELAYVFQRLGKPEQ